MISAALSIDRHDGATSPEVAGIAVMAPSYCGSLVLTLGALATFVEFIAQDLEFDVSTLVSFIVRLLMYLYSEFMGILNAGNLILLAIHVSFRYSAAKPSLNVKPKRHAQTTAASTLCLNSSNPIFPLFVTTTPVTLPLFTRFTKPGVISRAIMLRHLVTSSLLIGLLRLC